MSCRAPSPVLRGRVLPAEPPCTFQGFLYYQHTPNTTAVGSSHENTPAQTDLKSFTWHPGRSLYDSNKNSPAKSHIHTTSKHQQTLHTETDTAPFLLHLWLPGFPFSSPVSSDEPIVLFLTFTPPRFPNDGLASHCNCFSFYFENNFPFWGQCHNLESEEMSWYLKQNSALHNTWESVWLLLKRGARQTYHKIVQIMQTISLQFSPPSIVTAQFRISLIPKFLDTLEN